MKRALGHIAPLLPFTALLLLSATSSSAQTAPGTTARTAPDNAAIYKAINDGASRFYYPNLVGRYLAGDTTLTGDDFLHLYYGYAFQDAFRPLDPMPSAVSNLFALFGTNPDPNFDQCLALAKAGEKALEADPFNLQIINILMFAYGSVADRGNERINYFRFNNVINTIKSSGTGLTEKSPWHVLTFRTSKDILSAMGLEPDKRIMVSSTVEYISLVKKDGDVKGYYFDFGRVYWKKPDITPKQKHSIGINGLKAN